MTVPAGSKPLLQPPLPGSARQALPVLPLPKELLEGYHAAGLASGRHLNALLPAVAQRWSWLPAVTDGEVTMTYGGFASEVGRIAGFFDAAGVRAGDVVCWQSPNWWESLAMAAAIWHVGAVSAPVVTFYRHHELRHILGQLRPDVVVTASQIRGFGHAELFDELLRESGNTPKAKIVLRGSREGWTSYESLPSAQLRLPTPAGPEDPCLVLYTSGTTAAAKGAIHSSRSLIAATQVLVHEWGLSWRDTGYLAAPLQHVTGLLLGLTLPLEVGNHIVLADGWNAERAVRDIVNHQVTYSAGTTLFLQELTAATEASDHGSLPLKVFSCGGSPTPPSVVERAEAVGIPAVRVYGMTELPCVSLGHPRTPFARRVSTDGAISPGVEVLAVDEGGQSLPPGQSGELVVRGPELISGYVDPGANDGLFIGDGWFRTGDLGVVSLDGDVTITGRIKDIINRGGEKLSAREIEDRLITHPSVNSVAVVPGPDERLGEVPAAFIILTDGSSLDPDLLKEHLLAAGLPKQKTPVYWREVQAMPMTAAGKIKKFELTSRLAEELAADGREEAES